MFKHKSYYLQWILIVLIMTWSASPASACNLTVSQGDALTLAIASEQTTEIESIDITVTFDENVLEAKEATLTRGILEDKDYNILVNTETPGEITIVAIAWSNVVSDKGDVVFITFDVVGEFTDTSVLLLTTPGTDEPITSLGFDMNDTFCQCLRISVFDMNNDGRVGIEEALHVLQCVSGTKTCRPDEIGLEHAIYALQIVSGIKDIHYDMDSDEPITY